MNRTASRDPRRGFALLMALALLLIVTLSVSSMLERATVQGLIVQKQLDSYHRHHESLSVQAVASRWLHLARSRGQDFFDTVTRFGAIRTRTTMPDGRRVVLVVRDGQGTIMGRIDSITTAEDVRWTLAALGMLPVGRRDLVRNVGPSAVSLRSASDEVLLALAEGDPAAAAALLQVRAAVKGAGVDEAAGNPGSLAMQLQQLGIDAEAADQLAQRATLRPTLFELLVTVENREGSDGPASYRGMVETPGAGVSDLTLRQWEELNN